MKIAIIGTGNLGSAIAKGLINNNVCKTLYLTRRLLSSLKEFEDHNNVYLTTDNSLAIRNSDVLIFAVQPAQMKTILMDYILDNASYSSLQSVTSQTTNSNNGEAAAQTKVGELMDIVTEAIVNGLASMPTNGGTGCVNITVATHNVLERTKIAIKEVGGTTQINSNDYYVKVIDGNTLQLYKKKQQKICLCVQRMNYVKKNDTK